MFFIRCTKTPKQFSIVLTDKESTNTCKNNINANIICTKTKRGYMNVCAILAVITLAVSCGPRKKVITQIENPYDDSDLYNRVINVEERLATLESNHVSKVASINALQSQINTINDGQSTTFSDILALQSTIDLLQTQANVLQAQLSELNLNENIIELIDPCGDGESFDEVILKTSSGKYIAYFEDGGKRFLTVLTPNEEYKTTDRQKCDFSLNEFGTLEY